MLHKLNSAELDACCACVVQDFLRSHALRLITALHFALRDRQTAYAYRIIRVQKQKKGREKKRFTKILCLFKDVELKGYCGNLLEDN